MATAISSTNQILRLPTVMELTALSRSTIYAEIKAGRFPKQIHLTAKAVGWQLTEIIAHIEAKASQSRTLTKEGV